MAANRSIFLFVAEGCTLWVPTHVPNENENQPVHMLNYASPRELSRSFRLFDEPIQLVDDPVAAARISGAMTPADVIKAVNEFRRACAEDHDLLMKKCYNSNKQVSSEVQLAPQASTGPAPQPLLTNTMGTTGSYGASPNTGVSTPTPLTNQALLLMILQQQQQQQQQHQAAMLSQPSPLHQPPPMSFNNPSLMGSVPPPMGTGVNMPMDNRGMVAPPVPMPYGTPYYMMNQPVCGAGLMPPPIQYGGSAYGKGGRGLGRGARGGRGGNAHWSLSPYARSEPDPLPPLANIPPDVYENYVRGGRELVCATMPGPRCTAWAREHTVPTNRRDTRYVHCRGGVVLILKAKASDIENSKPVELIDQQVCAHFVIHGYCSRNNCMHRHYTEQQLRELIASKITELRALTKSQRQNLSMALLEKERRSSVAAHDARGLRSGGHGENTGKNDEVLRDAGPSVRSPTSPPTPHLQSFSGHAVAAAGGSTHSGGGNNSKARISGKFLSGGVECESGDRGRGVSNSSPSPLEPEKQGRKPMHTVEIGVTDSNSDNGGDDNDLFTGSNRSSTASAMSEGGLDISVDNVTAGSKTAPDEISEASKAASPAESNIPPEVPSELPQVQVNGMEVPHNEEGESENKESCESGTKEEGEKSDPVPSTCAEVNKVQTKARRGRRVKDSEENTGEVAENAAEAEEAAPVGEGEEDTKKGKTKGSTAAAKRSRSTPSKPSATKKRERK